MELGKLIVYEDGMTLEESENCKEIKCSLKREFLNDRNIKISELAYGTEKAKDVFRCIMQRADKDLGFKAEKKILKIDAIPHDKNTIMLIIKIADQDEEIDSRFTKFAPYPPTTVKKHPHLRRIK